MAKLNTALLILVSALILIIYGDLIIIDPVLKWDDESIIKPLLGVKSFFDYHISASIDLQPVRDISLLINIYIMNLFGISTFHLLNVLIWISILGSVNILLTQLKTPVVARTSLLLLMAVHPVFVNSVAWISARKHLLSCLFIFCATICFFYLEKSAPEKRKKCIKLAIIIFYLLSVLSQPISLLWPFWIIAYFLSFNCRGLQIIDTIKKVPLYFYFLLIIMVCCIKLNLIYYSTDYLQKSHYPKVLDFFGNMPTIPQMYGRYFINLVFPFNLAVLYEIFSITNIVGMVSFVLWMYFAWKMLDRRDFVVWMIFYLFPLAVVTVNITPMFVFDTYVVISSFAFFYINYLIFVNVHIDVRWKTIFTAILLSIIIIIF
ncbi:MAG: hypothetical protein HQK53_18465, partial [Oligoflexia bacterium]|nr:hypothetical protein [Oligoflexia bacterium]